MNDFEQTQYDVAMNPGDVHDRPFAEPDVTTVPRGQDTRYAKKYVRIPAEVMKHEIMPAAANLAAQALQVQQIPKGQRFKVYHELLSKYLELGIEKYRRENGLNTAQGQGVLSGITLQGLGSPEKRNR